MLLNMNAILGLISLLAVFAFAVAYLSYEKVMSWFKKKEPLLREDRDRVGILVLNHLSDGKYKTITGIFDTVTEELVANEVTVSKDVDRRIKDACQDGYAVYTIEN